MRSVLYYILDGTLIFDVLSTKYLQCLDSHFKVFKCAPSALCCPLPPSDPENLKDAIIMMPSVDRKMLYLCVSHLNIWLCMKMLWCWSAF